jgi:hypothetical protein
MAKRKSSEKTFDFNSCAVIVAHPDDEFSTGILITAAGYKRRLPESRTSQKRPILAASYY